MRILFLDHQVTLGGGQIMAARMVPALRTRGYEIDLLAGCPHLEGDPIPASFPGLRRAMRGYDLVYANTGRTAIAAATQSVPFLWHKHLPASTWLLRNLVVPRARRIISVCALGAPALDKVHVIYNGVPQMHAAPADGLPAGKKILLLGRVEREKGHDLAVEALNRMQTDATLVVAGPGDWYLPADERVVCLGLRKDVPALLAGCDVLLNASRFDEGAPLVVLEAQRAGIPIVATRVGGTPEIVKDGETAFIVPKEDPAAMAQALDRALAVDRAQWAAAGKAHADKFSVDACADGIAEVIDLCLEREPSETAAAPS